VRRDENTDGRYSDEDGAEVIETDAAAPAIGQPVVAAQVRADLLAMLR
jgi:hypothetical protein